MKGTAENIEAGAPERRRLVPGFAKAMAPRYGGATGSGRGLSPKRVTVRIVPQRTYSWDHRTLGGTYEAAAGPGVGRGHVVLRHRA